MSNGTIPIWLYTKGDGLVRTRWIVAFTNLVRNRCSLCCKRLREWLTTQPSNKTNTFSRCGAIWIIQFTSRKSSWFCYNIEQIFIPLRGFSCFWIFDVCMVIIKFSDSHVYLLVTVCSVGLHYNIYLPKL